VGPAIPAGVASAERGRVAEIDGLRAVAMTLVMAQHCWLASFGWVGVWLFFVISGYVISSTLIRYSPETTPFAPAYGAFIRRRFFRIVPVYALYVCIGAAAILLTADAWGLRDLPFLATFTYNWQMIFGFLPPSPSWPAFGHLWTLSVEEQFYVVYPLLVLLLPRRLYTRTLLALVLAGPLIRYVYTLALSSLSTDPVWSTFAVYGASFAHFDAFAVGALLAYFKDEIRTRAWVQKALLVSSLVAGIGYFVVYAQINSAHGAHGIDVFRNIYSGTMYGQGREDVVYSVVVLAAATAVIYAINQARLAKILGSPFLALVGRISYGGYVYHLGFLWLLAVLIRPIETFSTGVRIEWFLVLWSVTVLVAFASYRWFETPIRIWSTRARPVAAGSAHAGAQHAPLGNALLGES
jgi:peptidoglycan/LPS O-acetylase OafA/YrhL